MGLQAVALFALGLIVLLFGVATAVETRGRRLSANRRLRHGVYTLALGVYCSSWTFYGAVGSTVREGWNYLPIYLAPSLLLLSAPAFLQRLSRAVAEEQATSISDFVAARFGHDVIVARLVTVIALLGTIPYIALQLRSIGAALSFVSGSDVTVPAMAVSAAVLAHFAILFGARRFELAGRSEGLLFAIGLESLLKLLALVVVATTAVVMLAHAPPDSVDKGWHLLRQRFQASQLSMDTLVISLISAMALLVLPRQFYMGLVEARDPTDLPRARLGLAAYLLAMAAVVLPIAVAGSSLLGDNGIPDLYVLQLPAAGGYGWILVVALLGGVSAAASMVIVDSSALATMVSNDLLFPTLLRRDTPAPAGRLGERMLLARRLSIVGIIVLALFWGLELSPKDSLASIGLVAFAGMAQFTPHVVLATMAGERDPLAARVSLLVGMLLWLYTLALPPVLPADWLRGSLLDPQRLFGIAQASPIVHGVAWSLGGNLLAYALVAARKVKAPPLPRLLRGQRRIHDMRDLVQLTASFVGEERAAREFPQARADMPIDRRSAQKAQDLIARVVGASSARTLIASALAGGQLDLADVTRLLDASGQSLRFSRSLLAATFENIDAGISVVDADMALIAWNTRYLELFGYPPGMVRIGVPVADLIRYNARHGDFGSGDIDYHVEKRLEHMRRGQEHSFERHRLDGRVIKTVGGPMPGGGYVMSFTDITAEAEARRDLRRALDEMEYRVAERTHELSEANRRLALATQDKTRFLAAASHDLLQPLHAARLFTAVLERDVEESALPLVGQITSAIVAAENLLRALLDISKLDAGGVQPDLEPVALAPFLADLVESFRPMAEGKGLSLRTAPLFGSVESDPGLLRSVVQNFLANAIRYTEHGGVVVGVRRRGDMLRIDVIDTGVGIPPDQIEAIFGEFTRLREVEVEGLGLGLALAERIVRLLGGRIEVRSRPGKGSRFSLLMPRLDVAPVAEHRPPDTAMRPIRRLHVLVVDNDDRIVRATLALLDRLGYAATGAADMEGAMRQLDRIDAVLADYRLDHGEDGLTLIERMRRARPGLPAALITAEAAPAIRQRAAAMGVPLFGKPVSPETIMAFLAAVPETV